MQNRFMSTDLCILEWNMHDLFSNLGGFRYCKLQSPYFWQAIKGAKIFSLIETHHTANDIDELQIKGYKCFNLCRKKRRVGRNSGGIAVYIEESILPGVTKIPGPGSENFLIKLNADYFGLDRDVAVCFSYCVPEYSSYQLREQLDIFGDLEQKLSGVGLYVDKLCLGDYNARTGTKLDFLESEDNTDIPVPGDIYEIDTVGTFPRLNLDTGHNKYGDNLLSLCKSVPLRICNGRKLGDILGNYTCFTYNGQSCVDYCLASPNLFEKIKTFSVCPLQPTLSDHCPIKVSIEVRVNGQCLDEDYSFIDNPKKIPWNKDISYRFENLIQTDELKQKITSLMNDPCNDQVTIDRCTAGLTNVIIDCAVKADITPPVNKPKGGKNNGKQKKRSHPKWHDLSCADAHKKIVLTSKLLKMNPKNSYLRGKLQTEKKEFVDQLFTQLEDLEASNPRGYMELIKSMRSGNFDKQKSDDTSHVHPSTWHNHFSELLSKKGDQDPNIEQFIHENKVLFESELGVPFTTVELLTAIKSLKNNKSTSLDLISNEMLKTCGKIIPDHFLFLFNKILSVGCYPNLWKTDILNPIHKSDEKNDPNNFRGIALASCFGKLYTKLMRNRLETFCNKNNIIDGCQGSGKKNSRTADHLVVIRFLIDKIVKGEKGKLFACFVDIKKAFDFTPRNVLFYNLLNDYGVGGKFLNILMEMYTNHRVFVRVAGGLLQPITTTIGLKQGCGISPLLFNLFINKLPSVFDHACDPVYLGGKPLSSLLWADDLMIMSRSSVGLQTAIDRTFTFYQNLGLELNTTKTKVLIFNNRGLKLNNYQFTAGGNNVEVVDSYQYLGIKLKASGSMQLAVTELFDKANRAWFSISNILYTNKRLAVKKAFKLFDCLIRPILLYACEFWLPLVLQKKCFENKANLLKGWENFGGEILNQKLCRMLLSVHKRASRLAVLGELGRYPLLIPAIKLCLKYECNLARSNDDSLINRTWLEMKQMPHLDTYYSRVQNIKSLLNIPALHGTMDTVSCHLDKRIKGSFDMFYLDQINQLKIGRDSLDHNKLRFYKQLKGTFKVEPYIENICNRSQRAWLSRYRVSAHRLRIETGRYSSPVTPVSDRTCLFCDSNDLDDEQHFILHCHTFTLKRNCFFGRMSALVPNFMSMSDRDKLLTCLCPATTVVAKTVSKFLGIMSDTRKNIESGLSPETLNIYTKH